LALRLARALVRVAKSEAMNEKGLDMMVNSSCLNLQYQDMWGFAGLCWYETITVRPCLVDMKHEL
jgi:hypothetical protein